jgi:phage shock protein A
LYDPFQHSRQDEALRSLNRALANIKILWDNLQPQYNRAVGEIEVWHRVAAQALQQNREDLARAALARKLNYQKQATELKGKLDKLAKMTETLVRQYVAL